MIDRVSFSNFKSLGDVTVDLGRLTVLVGPNGCGKSSVLQGIDLLSKVTRRQPSEGVHILGRFASVFDERRDPWRLAARPLPAQVTLAVRSSDGDELKLAIAVPVVRADGRGNDNPTYHLTLTGGPGEFSWTMPESGATRTGQWLVDPRVIRFGSVVYLHLDASIMAETSFREDEEPRMGPDGAGLASTLAWMKGAVEDDVNQITLDLAKVVPGVRRIRTPRERVQNRRMERIDIDGQPVWRPVDETAVGDRFEVEFDGGSSVPSDLLSEGTVLALGLLTKLREPGRPKLVLLDDIDRGLHIEAQGRLVQVLRDMLAADPELQIICTTHSPYLLDRFAPDEVRVMGLDENRRTRVARLTDHPEFEKWRYGVQTGELWASLGEAWLTALRRPEL